MGAGWSSMELESHMANVGTARRFVREHLDGRAPDEAVSDLMLATSELVTNAFEHAAPNPVRLTVRVDDDEASVTVTSSGDGERVPPVARWNTGEPNRISGRGLGIVRRVADDVELQRSNGSVEITVRRRFAIADR